MNQGRRKRQLSDSARYAAEREWNSFVFVTMLLDQFLRMTGGFGHYQRKVLLLLCWAGIPWSIIDTGPVFWADPQVAFRRRSNGSRNIASPGKGAICMLSTIQTYTGMSANITTAPDGPYHLDERTAVDDAHKLPASSDPVVLVYTLSNQRLISAVASFPGVFLQAITICHTAMGRKNIWCWKGAPLLFCSFGLQAPNFIAGLFQIHSKQYRCQKRKWETKSWFDVPGAVPSGHRVGESCTYVLQRNGIKRQWVCKRWK